jgi:hypothetical protein
MPRNAVTLRETSVRCILLARRCPRLKVVLGLIACALFLCADSLQARQISLQVLVTPSTTITKEGRPVTFALHGFIEFKTLAELFPYIDSQTRRWKGPAALDNTQRQALAGELLRRGIESRVISMTDERPLETLVTHTEQELRIVLAQVHESTPPGYADAFIGVQRKWKHSLNCWSAAPSIPARALSNWYPIEEGITLYGATYDSTEHFWQAVKYHPDTTLAALTELLSVFEHRDWAPWLARLDGDPNLYLPNAYAVEFLRHNLAPDRLRWFRNELERHGLNPADHARLVQQRSAAPFRFTAFEEKVLWGDLADVFHFVYTLSAPDDPIRSTLSDCRFDAIYLGGSKMPFISEGFRSLMLEIWKVKYLQIPRFRELISSIPLEIRLSHFLNDGDSPDIPIPIYIDYLNQIRLLAVANLKSVTAAKPNPN